MALHDAYLRRTPFELTFPDAEAADGFTTSVGAAARDAGLDPLDRQAFVTLGEVGAYLRQLEAGGTGRVGAETAYDYALLLYHAFHFARAGAPTLLVSEATARALVDDEAGAGTDLPDLPAPAGYVQLPRNLFWIRSSPGEPAEPVDGFFWCLGSDASLYLLLAAGMRDDRPGLVVVPVPEAPWADAPEWLEARIRPQGGDFATTLPGGELERLYSFTAAGEVLKLAARLFSHVGSHRGDLVDGSAPAAATPTPSTLSYRRI
jgi:hypothetical protein